MGYKPPTWKRNKRTLIFDEVWDGYVIFLFPNGTAQAFQKDRTLHEYVIEKGEFKNLRKRIEERNGDLCNLATEDPEDTLWLMDHERGEIVEWLHAGWLDTGEPVRYAFCPERGVYPLVEDESSILGTRETWDY